MKRTIVLLVGMALLLLAPTASVGAAQTQSCSQAYYDVWESPGWETFGGDGLHVCYPVNFPNLVNVPHQAAGYCAAGYVKLDDNWNNCLGSARAHMGDLTRHICFYTGANYTGSRVVLYGGQTANWQLGNPFSDTISSIKWNC